MNPFKSLRIRFALWTAALILIVLVMFGAVMYLGLQQGLSNSIDDSMRLSASQAIAAINVENGQINFSDSIPSLPETNNPLRGVTIRILSLSGGLLQSTGPFSGLSVSSTSLQKAKTNTPIFETDAVSGSGPIRVFTAPILVDQKVVAVIQVIESLDPLTETLNNLLRIFLISLPIFLFISALSGYLLAARALTPIDQIIRTAQNISANDLSARLNLNGTDDEVRRLAATLDQMLERLEVAFRRERQFTADASHELRTPLTATRAILNVTRTHRRTVDEYEKALDDIAEETDRLHALTEDLLYIARGDIQNGPISERLNLSEILSDVCESLQPLVESKGLSLEWSIQEGLSLMGDSDALIRLFSNLIDNAVKYTDAGKISVGAELGTDHRVCVVIADTGRGIPAHHLPFIFQRFYRADPSRSTPGSGLGLAIAQEIVSAHQGTIQVTSQVGVGSKFMLSFPGMVQ
jgi:heavy metal sensor kinase